MSRLVDKAIDDAGLSGVLASRRAGAVDETDRRRVLDADLLALGALADRVRHEEVGDEVRIFSRPVALTDGAAGAPLNGGDEPGVLLLPGQGVERTGLDLLREVAIARVTGPRAARIRVDWTRAGLELAQVAIGFGANELVGHTVSKRGLPIADGELAGVGKRSRLEPAHLVKKRELAGFVRRAGRTPVFVAPDGSLEPSDDAIGTEEAG
jgi:hypothetical protein